MKKRVLLVILLIVAAAVAGTLTRSAQPLSGTEVADQRTEIHESYKLEPAAQVEVTGINGKVEIETSDSDTAEINIERTARNEEALSRRQITIEHTPTRLVIRSEQKHRLSFWNFWGGGNATEHVMLKLPRQISLAARGINGRVNVGQVLGDVRVSGVNGKVEVAPVSGYAEVSGVNGAVMVAVNQLGERGLRLSGINGRVELRLSSGLNADLQARGMNGGVSSEMPDVVVQKDENRSNYSARIGSGGSPISISGINGGVRLTRPAAGGD